MSDPMEQQPSSEIRIDPALLPDAGVDPAPPAAAASDSASDAQAALDHLAHISSLEVDLAENSVPTTVLGGAPSTVQAATEAALEQEVDAEQAPPSVAPADEEPSGGYSPSAPMMDDDAGYSPSRPMMDMDDSDGEGDGYDPTAAGGAGAPSGGYSPSQPNMDGEDDAEAEGQIDIGLGEGVSADEETPKLSAAQPLPSTGSDSPLKRRRSPSIEETSGPSNSAPRRRPAGQQRRSPSYSMDAPAAGPPSSVPAGPRRTSTASAPTQPRGAAKSYMPKYDFTSMVFPEREGGQEKWLEGSSVKKHPMLVERWREVKDIDSPAVIAHTLFALFDAARQDGDVEEARIWFNEFYKTNPTATTPLLGLINLELSHGNFPQVVALFEKALRGLGGTVGAVPGVPIWKAYLHYIRRQNPIPAPSAANASQAETIRSTVRSAYELALKECGYDMAAGGIWQEYIAFLGEKENTNAWEIQQQTDAIRKVYQRAVVIPMHDVEIIWREYDAFENKLNKMTAKKFLAERSPLYMTARTTLRDLKIHLEPLVIHEVPPRPTWTQADRDLVISWRKYLKWEESNPLDIDEPGVLQGRVMYAMRKCLTQMRFFPELWFQASSYLQGQNKVEEAALYLKTGLEANANSFLLTFSYAEHEEARKNYAVVKATFDSLIKNHGEEIDKLRASISEEAENAKGPELEDNGSAKVKEDDIEMDGAEPSAARKRYLEREARGQAVVAKRAKELDDMLSAAGVVWIMYMRFCRRAEGLKSARSIFTLARKSPYVSWQVFEASAYMEYHCNKDAGVATKIFELGLKAFPDEVAFAGKFLNFLLQINDDSNARALFERLALKFPAERARPIWDAWARYEYMYSDLSACQKLEARFSETFPNDAPLKRFAARYNYNGLDEIASRDLGFGMRPAPAVIPTLPAIKRPLPEDSPVRSPRIPEPRFRDDRPDRPPARAEPPPAKRARPLSREREPPRRGPPPQGENGWHGRREPSPPPRRVPERPPPMHAAPPLPPVSEPLDRSGLPKPIVWFLGNLPSSRSFDGPLYRPEDLMNLFRDARIGAPRQADYRGPPAGRRY